MMHPNIDVTPLVNPITNWVSVAPFMPKQEARKQLMERTAFTAMNAGFVDLFASETGPLAPTAPASPQKAPAAEPTPTSNESTGQHSAQDVQIASDVDIERISKQRVKLMAAKYASSKASSEIIARLEILNRRLSERAPRVSKDQVSALENAYDQLARIQAAREARAKRLGIPA